MSILDHCWEEVRGESGCIERCPWEDKRGWPRGQVGGLALVGGETLPVLSQGGGKEKGMSLDAK